MVFEKYMLHHIKGYRKVLLEIRRVTRREGTVIIVEANRMNPILYLHMTLMKGHQHFTKQYLKTLLASTFKNVKITSIESHVYPTSSDSVLKFMRILEDLLNKAPFKDLLSYNIVVAKNTHE